MTHTCTDTIVPVHCHLCKHKKSTINYLMNTINMYLMSTESPQKVLNTINKLLKNNYWSNSMNIKPKQSVIDDNVNRNKSVLHSHTLERSLKSLLAILKFRLEQCSNHWHLKKYHLQRKNIITSLLLQWNSVVIIPSKR